MGDAKGFIMCASSRPNYSGIVPGHTYTILQLMDVPVAGHSSNKSLKMLKFRGPFHDRHVTNCESHHGLAEACNHQITHVSDGTFWMPFHEFKKAFSSASLCFKPNEHGPECVASS